jgi:hypothetical protein
LGLLGVVTYIYWLFGPADPEWLFMINGVRWAIVLPIACLVLVLLFMGMWIGWTMFVTPSSDLIEEVEDNAEEEKEGK